GADIISRDTLTLPAVDTARGETIVKKEFRFNLSGRYSEIPGQKEAMGLLIDRIHALADSSVRVTITEPRIKSATYRILKSRVMMAIGSRAKNIDQHESSDAITNLVVVIEL